MVGCDPCLGSCEGVRCDEEDDIFGPERPAVEVSGQRECYTHAVDVQFAVNVLPWRNQDDCFCSVSSRRLKDRIYVLPTVFDASGFVGVVLRCDLETRRLEDGLELLCYPIITSASYQLVCSFLVARVSSTHRA